jgi:phage terminase large subunit
MAQITVDLTALPQLTNDVYYPLYTNKDRYLVLYGGASSGKSVFTAQKILLRMLTEKPHKFLVVRKVAKTLRQSTFALFRDVITSWGLEQLFTINKTDMEIRCVNGNQIIHAGLDDVEKLKSIVNVTGIWIEEASEITPEDFRQLDIRMRGHTAHYKQIILTFNPVSITHWLKTEFFDAKKDGVTALRTVYKDNKFLDAESIRVLEGFAETDPYYYAVYCLGEWGVIGKTVFDAQKVTARLLEVRQQPPLAVGSLIYKYEQEQIVDASIQFIEDGTGPLAIYEWPQAGYPYCIGGDIAEGGHDWSVGQVRNNITWQQAAAWRGQMDTDLYAKQMYCLGRYYNQALIAVETNFDSHPVKELQRLNYPRQYMREHMDSISGQLQRKYGFQTTKISRPVIISKYVAMARDHIENWHDTTTLEEMLTFVRDENGKPTAQEGQHDDCILADAICLEAREQQGMGLPVDEWSWPKGFEDDLKQDYYNAPPDEQRRLLVKWGIVKG